MYQMKSATFTLIVTLSLINLNQSSICTYDRFALQYKPLDSESLKLNVCMALYRSDEIRRQ